MTDYQNAISTDDILYRKKTLFAIEKEVTILGNDVAITSQRMSS